MYTCNVQYKVEPRCDAALASKLSKGIEYMAARYAMDMHRVSEYMMLACTCAMAWRFAVRAREVAGGERIGEVLEGREHKVHDVLVMWLLLLRAVLCCAVIWCN